LKAAKARVLRATAACALAIACVSALPATAQAWPEKPIKVVVNFAAGGPSDLVARVVSAPLHEALGQPVVVENRGGAGGNIGGEAVAKSPPDGYTLLVSAGNLVSVNPHIYPRMSFDPAKDLVPVAAAARVAVYLIVKPGKLPGVSTARDFVAYVKAHSGKLAYASPGIGTSSHIAAEMLLQQLNVSVAHVPYRGAGPALSAMLSGEVDFGFDPGASIPNVRAGRLRMLAVGSLKRSRMFPDVPTLNEIGFDGFDAATILGFYAPAGTAPEIVTRLNTEINRILETPAVRDRIEAVGGEMAPMTPARFKSGLEEDSKRYDAVIRARRIAGD